MIAFSTGEADNWQTGRKCDLVQKLHCAVFRDRPNLHQVLFLKGRHVTGVAKLQRLDSIWRAVRELSNAVPPPLRHHYAERVAHVKQWLDEIGNELAEEMSSAQELPAEAAASSSPSPNGPKTKKAKSEPKGGAK